MEYGYDEDEIIIKNAEVIAGKLKKGHRKPFFCNEKLKIGI